MSIQLTSKSRRSFVFENPTGLIGNFFGIEFDEESIRFPSDHSDNIWQGKTLFKSADECLQWFDNFEKAQNMKQVSKIYQDVSIKGMEPTDEEWSKIKNFVSDTAEFEKNEFVSFDTRLANNVMDRDAERLSLPVLKSFVKSIIGKSKLNNHNWWGDTGEGRFYDARLLKFTSVDEFMATLGFVPYRNFEKHLEKIMELESSLYWFAPKFYMHVIDKDAIIRMKAGVVSPMSIGFRYPLLVDVKDADGALLWREYRNSDTQEAEALEGSHVYLGAQYGAQSKVYKTSADEDSGDDLKTEVKEMPINLKLSIGEFTLDAEKDNTQFVDAVEKALTDSKADAETKLAETETAKKDVEDERDSVKAQLAAEIEEKARFKSALVEQIVQMYYQSGKMNWNDAGATREALVKSTYDELLAKHSEITEEMKKKAPAIVLTEVPEPVKQVHKNDRAFASD